MLKTPRRTQLEDHSHLIYKKVLTNNSFSWLNSGFEIKKYSLDTVSNKKQIQSFAASLPEFSTFSFGNYMAKIQDMYQFGHIARKSPQINLKT